jgi:hypothetical protein
LSKINQQIKSLQKETSVGCGEEVKKYKKMTKKENGA